MAAPPMVPRAPRLLIHLPRESPRTFKASRKRMMSKEAMPVKAWLSASFWILWSSDVDGDADAGEHHGGEIDDVRKPVTPAGEEAVLLAEAALGPEIDAALARPLLG